MADGSLLTVQPGSSTFSNRHSILNHSFGPTKSFQHNLNNITSVDNFLLETKAYPYERLKQVNSNDLSTIQHNVEALSRINSSSKVYQDQNEFKGHLV